MDTEGGEYVIFPSNGFKKVANKIDYIVGELHYFAIRNIFMFPKFVPMMLKEVGFETEFLPITNQYTKFFFDNNGKISEYSIERQTLFFSKKL